MADNPGEDEVYVGIGATIDEASVKEAIEVLKSMMESQRKTLEEVFADFKIGQPDQLKLEGISTEALQAAYKQMKEGMAEVAEGTKKVETTTEGAFGNMGQIVTEYRQKVDQMKAAIVDFSKASGKDLGEVYRAMKPEIKGGDTAAFTQAYKEAVLEAEKLQAKSQDVMGSLGSLTTAYRQKVDDMKGAIKDFAEATGASFEDIKKGVAPSVMPVDRPAFTQAFKEIEAETKEAQKTTTDAMVNMGASVDAYRTKVDQIKEAVKAYAAQSGESLTTIQKAVSKDIPAPDLKAFNQAFSELQQEQTAAQTNTATVMANMGQYVDAYRTKVDQLKQAFRDYIQTSGASLKDVSQAVIPKLPAADQKVAQQAVKELGQELDNTGIKKDKFKGNVITLGDVFRIVFGVTVGQMAVQMIRKFISALSNAVTTGETFLGTLFKLNVAVRALQRNGLDITMEDITKELTTLEQKFPIFSRQQLTEGVTNALLFTNNLKLTREQIDQMIQSSITLALVMGKDVNEVMRTFALTMSSGYSEGLQRLGISINRVVIAQKAMELGFSGNYRTLTQNQIATAALALVVEQTNRMTEDAAKYQKTWTGTLEVGKKAADNFWMAWGERLAPILSMVIEKGGKILDWLREAMKYTDKYREVVMDFAMGGIGVLAVAIRTLWETITKPGTDPVKYFTENFDKMMKAVHEKTLGIVYPEKLSTLGNAPVMNTLDQWGLSEDEQSKVMDAADNINTQLQEIAQKGADKLVEIEKSKADDLEQIDLQLYRDLEDAQLDYQRTLEQNAIDNRRKLEDINKDLARNQAQAATDLGRDLDKIERDTQNDIEQAKIKYQQASLDNEAEYQLKIKQMQEQYLYDLDEAIRSRNAKQALQITRRLKLEYSQAQEQHQFDVGQMQTNFERELAEMEREKQIRIQQRQLEYQQKLADLAIQAQQERIDEATRYAQQQVDEATRYAQKRADLAAKAAQERRDRIDEYNQQLRDLATSQNNQLRVLADGLVKQYNLTGTMLKATYMTYLAYYGPGGAFDKLYAYMVASANKAAGDTAGALGKIGTAGVQGSTPTGKGYASGGSFIASSPVTATFGEGGTPELVQITPLNQIGHSVDKTYGSLSSGNTLNNMQRKLKLEILLSRDLEARMIGNALDQMSDILVSVERER